MEDEEHSLMVIKEELPSADDVVKLEVNDREETDLFNDPLIDDPSVRQTENLELSSVDSSKEEVIPIQPGSVCRPLPKTYANRRKNQSQEFCTSSKSKEFLTGRTEFDVNLNPGKSTITSKDASQNFVSALIKAEILEDPDLSAEPGPSDVGQDVRYMDSGDVVHDELLYCLECLCAFCGECPKHGSLVVIPDTPILDKEADEFRALKTAPLHVIITDSKIPNAGRGVIARAIIPDRSRFGPYEGHKVSCNEGSEYAWLIRRDGFSDHCIDATDPRASNWMRFVNCARNEVERNLFAFQYHGSIYFRTIRVIRPGEELLVWCGNNYAQRLGIDLTVMDATRFRNLLQVTSPNTSDLTYTERRRIRLEAKRKDAMSRKIFNPSFPKTGGLYSSAVCTRRFHSQELRDEHLQAHSNGLRSLCEECFKCFRKKGALEIHKLAHSDDRSYDCPLCDMSFSAEREVRIHVFSHCLRNPPVCALCQKQVMQLSELKYHLREHFGEVFKTYRCTKCDEGFPGEVELSRHLKLCRKEGLYICTDCNRFCWTAKDLKRHIRTHPRGRTEEGFRCRKCGDLFAMFRSLEKHSKKHHVEVQSLQCGRCDERMLWKEVKMHALRCSNQRKT